MRCFDHHWGRWLGIAMAAAATAIVAALMGGSFARADAAACGSDHCVVLIEVNGLTPQDVSPEKTPFLWALAHPNQPQGLPNEALSALAGGDAGTRAGWIWQAARGVMSSSTAAATASLLTGSQPEKTEVPANVFLDPADKRWNSLQAGAVDENGNRIEDGTLEAPDSFGMKGQTILSLVQENASGSEGGGGTAAKAYVGDPALFDLVTGGCDSTNPSAIAAWKPQAPGETACQGVTLGDGNPANCPPPRLTPSAEQPHPGNTACPADDMQTMNAAGADLGTVGDRLRLAYIHLAELGIVKQRAGNVPAALADLDAAVMQYIGRYAQTDPEKWDRTVVMVVGNHGYESTPQPLRVPSAGDGEANDAVQYIEEIAAEQGGSVEVAPQGTLATVRYTGEANARGRVLKAIRTELLALNDSEPQCAPRPEADLGRCVDDVLYTTDPPEGDKANTLKQKHPTWRVGDFADAVVVTGRGWAVAPVVSAETGVPPDLDDPNNPYVASDGGPRNRAVAALVHGPESLMKQFPWEPTDPSRGDGRHPVTAAPATDGDPTIQPPKYENSPTNPAVEQANAEPGDDLDDTGHETQPQTVDFMPTIAALLKISLPPDQPDGTIIQSPWKNPLAPFEIEEDLGEPEPEPEPPPIIIEEPPVIITPPPPRIFDFHGLLQKLTAQVGTVQRRTVQGKKTLVFVPAKQAKRGSLLNYLALKADFGKELAQVTLTLYRKATSKSKKGKARLVSIARFSPFTVNRGEGVELRFAVPPKYRPTAIGVLVQEAEKIAKSERKKGEQGFRGVGPVDGGIFSIKNAALLHKRAGGKRKRR
jgi:hypothetical protein